MIRESFPGINSPGQAPVDHAPAFSAACTRFHLPVILGILGILGILHHQTASIESGPEKRRDLSHVTQPRARINVSCSRADHK